MVQPPTLCFSASAKGPNQEVEIGVAGLRAAHTIPCVSAPQLPPLHHRPSPLLSAPYLPPCAQAPKWFSHHKMGLPNSSASVQAIKQGCCQHCFKYFFL